MRRKALSVLGMVVVLAAAATAFAAEPVTPKTGWFKGATSQGSSSEEANLAALKVSRSSAGSGVELLLDFLVLSCDIDGIHVPVGKVLTSKSFEKNGKADPLSIENGKFLYEGPVYRVFSTAGRGEISGKFKSPTKVVGRARFSWKNAHFGSFTASCGSGKLNFSATYTPKKPTL